MDVMSKPKVFGMIRSVPILWRTHLCVCHGYFIINIVNIYCKHMFCMV